MVLAAAQFCLMNLHQCHPIPAGLVITCVQLRGKSQPFAICVSSGGESAAVGEQSPNEMSHSRAGHIGPDEVVQAVGK